MNDRIVTIDAIRGSALFGIFVVNILAFSSVWYGTGLDAPLVHSTLDKALDFAVSALFELKFYLLFSFLFGYSVTLQMLSADKAGEPLVPRMIRRQIGLFLIGAFHAVVLFHGDILTTYAILGLVLLALRGLSDRVLLALAAILLLLTSLLWVGIAVWQATLPDLDQTELARQMISETLAGWLGTPGDIIASHIRTLAGFLPLLVLLQAPTALAMFLLGYVAGRNRIFSRPDLISAWIRPIVSLGLFLGLPGGIAYAMATTLMPGTALETAGLALSVLTAPFLSAAIVAGLIALFTSGRLPGLRALLASAGRMALSNYLLQSLVSALIFHGYGLGLMDSFGTSMVLAIACLVFAGQLVVSHWWMARFRYGPLEWFLRALTLWRLPALWADT